MSEEVNTKLRDALYRLERAQIEEQDAMDAVADLLGRPNDGADFLRVLQETCEPWAGLTCVRMMQTRHKMVERRIRARG